MSRFRAVAVAAAAALALAGVAAQPAKASPDTPNRGQYAAIGDSYAAGFGASVAYPVLLAGKANKVNFLAVSGATTQDVIAEQIGRITPGTRQVTITVGGNDVGFGQVVATCTQGADSTACGAALAEAQAKIPAMTKSLSVLIQRVKKQEPRAEIYVTGYPILFQAPGTTCTPDFIAFDAANAALNAAIQKVALAKRVTYVDVTDDFAGHGICQGAESWILPTGTAALHPTDRGQQAYADAIEATSFISAAETVRPRSARIIHGHSQGVSS